MEVIVNRGKSINVTKDKKNGYIIIHLLVTLFGISAWIGVNGIFVQLPILVHSSPEGWALPTYIVLAVQAANLGPIIYIIFQQTRYKLNEARYILIVLISGTFSMFFLSFFYDKQIIINESKCSLILFILTFFVSLVGCFSSVLFMPYFRNFDEVYMISYFIGEGLSGVLPSIGILIQGLEENDEFILARNDTLKEIISKSRFSTQSYFLYVSVILLLSLASFILLEYCAFFKENRNVSKQYNDSHNKIQGLSYISITKYVDTADHYHGNNQSTDHIFPNEIKHQNQNFTKQCEDTKLSSYTKYYLFTLMILFCFFGNGILPSMQSYSCLPYGNISYQLAITLAQFANPIACFIALWIMPLRLKVINSLLIVSCILCTYVISVALLSPNVPLKTSTSGVILIVTSWTILIGSISYGKLIIVSVLRSVPIPNILFYIGFIMQTGSACGAITSFAFINFTTFFQK